MAYHGPKRYLKGKYKRYSSHKIQKVHSQVSLRKQRLLLRAKNGVVQCLQLPMRMWDTPNHRPTNLWHSVGATGMGLFQHYRAMKVETTKVPCGPGPLMTSSPDSWHSRTKRMLCDFASQNPSGFNWPSKWKLVLASCGWWKPETIFLLVIRPSSQDTEQGERKISSGSTQGIYSKVCLNRCRSGGKHELTNFWGQLQQQAYRTYACVLPNGMTNVTKDRDEGKRRLSLGGKGTIENKRTHNKSLPELLYLRN